MSRWLGQPVVVSQPTARPVLATILDQFAHANPYPALPFEIPATMLRCSYAADRTHSIVASAGLSAYILSDQELSHGSSLGNMSCWVTAKSTGAIEGVFSIEVGKNVFGSCMIRYCRADLRLVGPVRERRDEGVERCQHRYVELSQDVPGSFEIHPAYQKHRFTLPGDLDVEETSLDLLDYGLSYYVELYDSELQDWTRGLMRTAEDL